MTREKGRIVSRFLVIFVVLGGIGLLASVYTLVHERLPLPFGDNYEISAQFSAADGVVSGIGQPVNVVGVNVGEVTAVRLVGGAARVTMRLDRHKVPRVYENATATLEPITPLEDMQIDLDPGSPPAPLLRTGATLSLTQTSSPPQLSDLLSTLDGDTRSFLQSLIASLGQAVAGRGDEIRRALATLGPTTAQAGSVVRALAARRSAIARLVHNLARLTRAASQDRQLAAVVTAGDQTLRAVADQDASLRSTLAQLPPTLMLAHVTLSDLEPFARLLGPTLRALAPAVRRLPATFDALGPLARVGAGALRTEIRPLVLAAAPLVSRLGSVLPAVRAATPDLTGSFQALEYLANELAYHPPGNGEGLLFWLAWFFHNGNSVTSSGDANGGIGRALPLISCQAIAGGGPIGVALGLAHVCPK
jgi:phospholipid/cholesterol/gamma-HCH transport system substrate-binding protein